MTLDFSHCMQLEAGLQGAMSFVGTFPGEASIYTENPEDHSTGYLALAEPYSRNVLPFGSAVSINDPNPILNEDSGPVIIRRTRQLQNPPSSIETEVPHVMMIQGAAPRRIRLQKKLQISCSFKSVGRQNIKPEEESKPVVKEVISFEAATFFTIR